MNWNNGIERRRFKERMRMQAEEYRKAGMTDEQIDAMREFDYQAMLSNRRFYEHTDFIDDICEDYCTEDEGIYPICCDSHGWIYDLQNERLIDAVLGLNDIERYVITLIVFYGYSQHEVGKFFLGLPPKSVSRIVASIRVQLLPGLSSVQNKNSHNCGGDQ